MIAIEPLSWTGTQDEWVRAVRRVSAPTTAEAAIERGSTCGWSVRPPGIVVQRAAWGWIAWLPDQKDPFSADSAEPVHMTVYRSQSPAYVRSWYPPRGLSSRWLSLTNCQMTSFIIGLLLLLVTIAQPDPTRRLMLGLWAAFALLVTLVRPVLRYASRHFIRSSRPSPLMMDSVTVWSAVDSAERAGDFKPGTATVPARAVLWDAAGVQIVRETTQFQASRVLAGSAEVQSPTQARAAAAAIAANRKDEQITAERLANLRELARIVVEGNARGSHAAIPEVRSVVLTEADYDKTLGRLREAATADLDGPFPPTIETA